MTGRSKPLSLALPHAPLFDLSGFPDQWNVDLEGLLSSPIREIDSTCEREYNSPNNIGFAQTTTARPEPPEEETA